VWRGTVGVSDLVSPVRRTAEITKPLLVEAFLGACLGGRSGGFDFFELAAWAF
jgi:hypothetical protein